MIAWPRRWRAWRFVGKSVIEHKCTDGPAVQKPSTVKWSWLGLSFAFSDRKLVVGRKRASGGIHLTISYGNASGELDLHLKREPVAPGEDPYIPLARIAPDRLTRASAHFNAVGERIASSMSGHWRRVRPGWLARNGYLVTLFEKEPSAKTRREVLLPLAPRRHHGKHQVTLAPLKDPAYLAQFADNLFHPAILRELDPSTVQQPIRAISAKRGRPPLLIGSFNIDGHREWFMCPEHRLRECLDHAMATLMTFVGSSVGPGHLAIFQRISVELGLAEISELTEVVEAITDFLASPQEVVATVQRRGKAWAPAKRLHPASLTTRLRDAGNGLLRSR